MNETYVTVVGNVATEPRPVATANGQPMVSFRMASTPRRFNRASNAWEDGFTSWYGVSAFRSLADNVRTSIAKGDRVVVHGKLGQREFEREGNGKERSAEIQAEAIGHELTFATSRVTRVGSGRAGSDADVQARRDEGHRSNGPFPSEEQSPGAGSSSTDAAGWYPSPAPAEHDLESAAEQPPF